MKKIAIVLLALAVSAIAGGCGERGAASEFNPTQNSVYISGSGEIKSAIVYSPGKEYDTSVADELKAFLSESVIEYNTAQGGSAQAENTQDGAKLPVAIESCQMSDGTATVIFNYKSAQDLIQFAEQEDDDTVTLTELDVMNVSEGLAVGKILDSTFVKAKDMSTVGTEAVTKQGNSNVATVRGKGVVQVEGAVQFVSTGCTIIDNYTVETPDEGKYYIVFK